MGMLFARASPADKGPFVTYLQSQEIE